MALKSFGCSFIFGSDLADDVSNERLNWNTNQRYSKLTWPALLANEYNHEYSSRALPGIGNLQILEYILQEIPSSTPSDLFVIQWSWIDRFDYEATIRGDKKRKNFWNTILPAADEPAANWYFKYIHSQYRDKLTALTNIKLAIDSLDQQKIPFIMTNIDDLVFESKWHSNTAIEYLQKSIQNRITTFNGLNFLDWAIQGNFPISANHHPLEEAHLAAFELIKSYNLV